MLVFDRPLPVGKTGNYILRVDAAWLGSESVTGATVTVPNGAATVGLTTTAGTDVQVFLTGVTAGRHKVHFEYETPTRSGCLTVYVEIVNC